MLQTNLIGFRVRTMGVVVIMFLWIADTRASTTSADSSVIVTSAPDMMNSTSLETNSTSEVSSDAGSGDTSSGDAESPVTSSPGRGEDSSPDKRTTTEAPTTKGKVSTTTKQVSTTPVPEDGFFKSQMIMGMAGGFGCFVGLIIAIVIVWNCVCGKFCGDPSKKGNGRKIRPVDFRSPASDISQSSSQRRLSISTASTGS